jgi:hypothetical protein
MWRSAFGRIEEVTPRLCFQPFLATHADFDFYVEVNVSVQLDGPRDTWGVIQVWNVCLEFLVKGKQPQ